MLSRRNSEGINRREITRESFQHTSYDVLRGTINEQKRQELYRLVGEERQKDGRPLTRARMREIENRILREERQRKIRNYMRFQRAALFLEIVFDGARTIRNWRSHWYHVTHGGSAGDYDRAQMILKDLWKLQRNIRILLEIDKRVLRGLQSTRRVMRHASAFVWRHLRTSPYSRLFGITQPTETNTQASIRRRNRVRSRQGNPQHNPWAGRLRHR